MNQQDLKALIERLQGMQPQQDEGDIADEAIANVLQSVGQPVYQVVFDRGHSRATGKAKESTAELEGRIKDLEKDIQAKETALKELEGKTPELEAEREKYRRQITELQHQHKEELRARDQRNREREQQRQFTSLEAALIGMGVRPMWARGLAADPDVRQRVRVSDDGTEVEVLQRGKDVPFAPSEEATPLELLAQELRKETPDDMIVANGDRGTGSRPGGGSGPRGFDYRKHRETLAEQRKQAREQARGPSALEKLGGRPVT